MKKFLALLLALVMVFALAACGDSGDAATPTPAATDPATDATDPATEATDPAETGTNPDDIPDTMESEDNTYEIAFVTDVGQLKDKSFNEGTWNGVKTYAYENDLSYKYYQPANGDEATDDDRYDAMAAAVNGGAKVVVCAGYLQEAALRRAAIEFPEVNFVFIDGYAITEDPEDANSAVLANVAGINFSEEQCGYLAGYAVVKDGFTQLGFSGGGGGTNPACCRYGYGFLQGASAAAAELGVEVNVNYSWQYGETFQASTDLQTMIAGWYNTGTEIVFACGGNMFASISAAASAADGFVVGVDVDQSSESATVVTSAMKGIDQAAILAIGHSYDGTWDEVGGKTTTLGANEDAVGLPTAADSWRFEAFTVDEYNTLLESIKDGSLVIDSEYPVNDDGIDNAGILDDADYENALPNITINVV